MPVNNVTFAVIVLIIYMVIAQIETVYLITPRRRPGTASSGVTCRHHQRHHRLCCSACITPHRRQRAASLLHLSQADRPEPFELAPHRAKCASGVVAGRKIERIFDLDGTLAFVDWHFAGGPNGVALLDRTSARKCRRTPAA